jgi:hypothetical protein
MASTTALPLEFGIAERQGYFRQYNVALCNITVGCICASLVADTLFHYQHYTFLAMEACLVAEHQHCSTTLKRKSVYL